MRIITFYATSSLSKDELIKRSMKIKSLQICDEKVGMEFLKYSIFNALKLFEKNENITKNEKMEILLLASCTDQINTAIENVGIKDPKKIVIGYWGKNLRKVIKYLKIKKKKMRYQEEDLNEKIKKMLLSIIERK